MYPDMTENTAFACEELYRSYGTMLYRICLTYLHSSHDAEDALQDIFCKYLLKPRLFKSEEHKKAFFIKVTANHCKDILRHRKRRKIFEYSDEVGEETYEQTEDFGVLEKIFALPEKYKEVFVFHYLENLSVSEISEAVGISESAVKMRLMRGREILKDLFSKEGVEL